LWGWSWGYGQSFVLLSHYNYRLVPSCFQKYQANPTSDSEPAWWWVRFTLDWVRPEQKVLPGEPVFKTQKQLQGRALVSDAFGKNMAFPAARPGMGFYGHRDGYNVLYGDWSAKWYGDPQQRIMYWHQPSTWGANMDDFRGMDHNCIIDFVEQDSLLQNVDGCHAVWHIFDMDHGIDIM